MTGRLGWRLGAGLLLAASAAAPPLAAQQWTGAIGAAYVFEDVGGSAASFRSQTTLGDGFDLEGAWLEYRPDGEAEARFALDASGFGNAEPVERARLRLRAGDDLDLDLSYAKRESFFGLAESDLATRADAWEITRWNASATWDGWQSLRATLTLRRIERDGVVERPFYGLNELYRERIDLDETKSEAVLRLETKTLPVRLELEQSFARYERRNRHFAAGETSLGGDDPDLLADLGADFDDTTDVPTTRLVASYAAGRLEGVASLLWSDADLDATGSGWTSWAVGGGPTGTIEYLDRLVGSAQRDTLAGAVRLGLRIAERWSLRLDGEARDAATDSALLGERLLRFGDPTGTQLELGAPIDESSVFELSDSRLGLTLEHRARSWSAWAGGFVAARDVDWRLAEDGSSVDVNRDSDGVVAGAALDLGSRLSASLELESGGFERYVFRTDPESVDRASLRLRARLGDGWSLNAHARHEEADNPPTVAALDHRSTAAGLGCGWTSAGGERGFALDLERIDLATDTGLVLPDGEPGLAAYELELLSATASGHAQIGRVGLRGSLTRLEDDGASWPVEAWTATGRVSVPVGSGLELAAFGQHWSYDEQRADRDDFDVTRYGLAIVWRQR